MGVSFLRQVALWVSHSCPSLQEAALHRGGAGPRQVDTKKLDERWHTSPAILQNDEHVEMAFKGRRDMTVFTPKRLIIVDVQGMTGKRVKYISVPWTTVKAFGVRSAGSFMDKDRARAVPGAAQSVPDLNAGIGCESWQLWRVGSRDIRVTEDTNAARLVGQAVVADRWRRSGKQRAALQGWGEGHDEDVMHALHKQIRSPVWDVWDDTL